VSKKGCRHPRVTPGYTRLQQKNKTPFILTDNSAVPTNCIRSGVKLFLPQSIYFLVTNVIVSFNKIQNLVSGLPMLCGHVVYICQHCAKYHHEIGQPLFDDEVFLLKKMVFLVPLLVGCEKTR
jgi:hypothetical protein